MKKAIQDPGFGSNFGRKTKRIINRDGSFNVERRGVRSGWQSIYHELIDISTGRFLLVLFGTYISLNLIFASFYYLIGSENLSMDVSRTGWEAFLHCFFFSTQTFTTVGYGAISPIGAGASLMASFEAMTGLLSFALATGLLWGRFSRPRSRILFSDQAIIAPYQDGTSLQFRVVNERKNTLMELEAKVVLATKKSGQSGYVRQYFQLPLEISRVNFLPLSWTVVHPINEDSPVFGWGLEEFMENDAEILVMISGFDDTFNQVLHSRCSYTIDELVYGARFVRAFKTDEEGSVNMHIHDIHQIELVESLK